MSSLIVTPTIKKQLASRSSSLSIKAFVNNERPEVLVFTSPSDVGVIRNGGKLGAGFGPKVIINELKKFQHHSHSLNAVKVIEVTNKKIEREDFTESQTKQSIKLKKEIKAAQSCPIIHLGGGHDHIFPLLKSLLELGKKINIINLDAHLDTRVEQAPHSGTPFRQFDAIAGKDTFKLHQIGIHQETNAIENFQSLRNGAMVVHEEDLASLSDSRIEKILSQIIEQKPDWINVLSIDLDGLDSSEFQSCSAINPKGFNFDQLNKIIQCYESKIDHSGIYGMYEYNPLFDNLANKDGKKIAWSINQILKRTGKSKKAQR